VKNVSQRTHIQHNVFRCLTIHSQKQHLKATFLDFSGLILVAWIIYAPDVMLVADLTAIKGAKTRHYNLCKMKKIHKIWKTHLKECIIHHHYGTYRASQPYHKIQQDRLPLFVLFIGVFSAIWI